MGTAIVGPLGIGCRRADLWKLWESRWILLSERENGTGSGRSLRRTVGELVNLAVTVCRENCRICAAEREGEWVWL